MKNLLIITLLLCSIQSFGQKTREIGMDLYTSGYELIAAKPQNLVSLKLNYKKHEEQIVKRWHMELGHVFDGTIVFDTIVLKAGSGITLYYFNNTRRLTKLGLYHGMEKKQSLRKGEFYYGGDVGVKLFQVISGPKWSPQSGYNYGGVEQFPDDKKTADIGLVVTPFSGVRFPISKKIWFNVELGAEVNYMITNRPYYRGDGNWEDAGEQYFDFPALDKLFINNIGLSYRF